MFTIADYQKRLPKGEVATILDTPTWDYNCLAFALGTTDEYIWPNSEEYRADRGEPGMTQAEVLEYLSGGKRKEAIVAYGRDPEHILHFGVLGKDGQVTSKWGSSVLAKTPFTGVGPQWDRAYGKPQLIYDRGQLLPIGTELASSLLKANGVQS